MDIAARLGMWSTDNKEELMYKEMLEGMLQRSYVDEFRVYAPNIKGYVFYGWVANVPRAIIIEGATLVPTYIGMNTALESLQFPDATEIEIYGLKDNAGKGSCSEFIGEKITKLGIQAFYGCNRARTIKLGLLSSVGNLAFTGVENCDIYVKNTMASIQSLSGYPWSATSGCRFVCSDGTLTVA